jgi:hypothetical protein
MILLQINPAGVLAFPFKCEAPGAIDVHRVADWPAAQSMEIETGQVHLVWSPRVVQAVEARQDSPDQIGANA